MRALLRHKTAEAENAESQRLTKLREAEETCTQKSTKATENCIDWLEMYNRSRDGLSMVVFDKILKKQPFLMVGSGVVDS